MCTHRHLAVISTFVLTTISIPLAVAAGESAPTIQCEARPGYHLCEAQSEDGSRQHEWSVTGDLAINLASGPLASISCQDGQSGALWLETRGPEGRARACVQIECGAESTPSCKG